MNKNFIIMNKNNNTQMQASSLVKFNFNNKDYLYISLMKIKKINKFLYLD